MKRLSLLVGAGVLAAATSPVAFAGANVSIGIGLPGVVVAPAPVYYEPAPVYVAPPPVERVYLEPRVVYPAPRYYAPFDPYWDGRRYQGHRKHRHDDDDD